MRHAKKKQNLHSLLFADTCCRRVATLLLLSVVLSSCSTSSGQQKVVWATHSATLTGSKERELLRNVTTPGKPTTGQTITPAGVQMVVQARIFAVAFGRDSSQIWLMHDGGDRFYRGDLVLVDWKQNKIVDRFPIGGTPGLQGLSRDDTNHRLLATVITPREPVRAVATIPGVPFYSTQPGMTKLLSVGPDGLKQLAGGFGTGLSGAVAASVRRLTVPLSVEDKLAILDADGKLEGKVAVGIAPSRV